MFPGKPLHVLIIASGREDRRRLFDALDGEDLGALHTARDAGQASSLIAEEAQMDVVIIDFVGDASENVAFCAKLHSSPEYAHVKVLGILAAESRQRQWGFQQIPDGVDEWIRSPVDAGEVCARLKQMINSDAPTTSAKTARAISVSGGDYRFAFETDEDEILVLDPATGEILEVNPAYEQRSGYIADQVLGRSAAVMLGLSDEQLEKMRQALERDGVGRRRCNRARIDGGADIVNMTLQPALRGDHMVHVVSLRDRREMEAARMALGLLARMQATSTGEGRMATSARLLADLLQLNYVAVYSTHVENMEGPQLINR
ncbi:PAS domain S-box protein, partial [Oleiagrimonas sp.]|uniref:PAS domain S-box protein n=1 Tax=Oleiagrimonas sp. TaxID=2010330 RepID=UPI002605F0B1